MPSPLLTLKRSATSYRILQSSVRYAGGDSHGSDPKRDIIRRILYPTNLRNKPTPTGTWRPDVAKALRRAIPSKQAHETIERAWKLHQRQVRLQRDAELTRKYECMRAAMLELEQTDTRLFREANRPEDPRGRTEAELHVLKQLRGVERKAAEARIRGLFPRELRIPTDTPSKDGWNHEWTQPIRRA